MQLREFFTLEAVGLDLAATSKSEALKHCVDLLGIDDRTAGTVLRMLDRREQVGSTGFGHGIAIPHCRSLVITRLRMAYGRFPTGVEFDAVDGQPVYHIFLITAPPVEVSNQYLQVLAQLAAFARDGNAARQLNGLSKPSEFLSLLEARGG